MTEPLDFTKAGRDKAAAAAAPPPQKAPDRPRRDGTSPSTLDRASKSKLLIALVVIAAVIIGVVFVVSRNKTSSTKTLAMNAARYCQLSIQFDSAASGTGASSTPGMFDGPATAMAELLKQTGPTLSEMRSDAPSAVRSDVDTVVSAVEKAAKGDRSGVVAPTFAAAQQRLDTYQRTTCSAGGGSGDG